MATEKEYTLQHKSSSSLSSYVLRITQGFHQNLRLITLSTPSVIFFILAKRPSISSCEYTGIQNTGSHLSFFKTIQNIMIQNNHLSIFNTRLGGSGAREDWIWGGDSSSHSRRKQAICLKFSSPGPKPLCL